MPVTTLSIEALIARGRARRGLPPPDLRRLLRERAGLSQAEIAGVLGVDAPTVSRWESGRRRPSGPLLDAYLAVLDRLARLE